MGTETFRKTVRLLHCPLVRLTSPTVVTSARGTLDRPMDNRVGGPGDGAVVPQSLWNLS
jgi:hypothetical protein